MKTIDQFNFKNKKALIRVDFNVPLDENFEITDTSRIDATIPTIKKVLKDGGSVILMSHLGRPKSGPEDKFSLKHLLKYLSSALKLEVQFANDCIGEEAKQKAVNLKNGEVLLLENLRFYKEETAGDEDFSKKLASLADAYINDAFGTAHRAHASTAIIAKYFPENKMFGYIMNDEISNINKVMVDPWRPFTTILGGAKVSGKVEVITNLLDKVDNLIIGGGMMFTFIKALGGNIGNSLVEESLFALAVDTINFAKDENVNLYLPTDAVIADGFSNDAKIAVSSSYDIPDGWMGLDIGPETVKKYISIIEDSTTILWNGPMGVFEMSNFENGTREIALAVAKATKKGAYSLIGGGDSVAAINKYNLKNKVSYISTGGGAMLEYIEGKILPGIQAIEE
ncbi:MAG: phosphoglycerate kinase [Bacteroidetes bacterium HGW-Bacteroidetes-17]|jgi:phosphoglycerate kinase|nr:MAG: phosphoglycerate kinase [Bacteroidetes bacterium HGW-Bacteroidetes-17]